MGFAWLEAIIPYKTPCPFMSGRDFPLLCNRLSPQAADCHSLGRRRYVLYIYYRMAVIDLCLNKLFGNLYQFPSLLYYLFLTIRAVNRSYSARC